jgi:hypothetical protein
MACAVETLIHTVGTKGVTKVSELNRGRHRGDGTPHSL